jgi:hypothetical protein
MYNTEAQSCGLIQGSNVALALREATKNLGQNGHCLRWDSYLTPPKYKSQALQFESNCRCNKDKETDT